MAAGVRRRNDAIAEINVTPMCDVMIVLLVIFMVVTPIVDRVPGLDLPAARTARALEERDAALVVIHADGRVEMGNELFVSPAELMIRLQARLQEAGGASRAVRVQHPPYGRGRGPVRPS
jgi:biopolymer transport protein ExbD/biopolymer transport protein TolR